MIKKHDIKEVIYFLKIIFLSFLRRSDIKRWIDNSNLYPDWDLRTQLISTLIPPKASVIEFGAGRGVLKNHLSTSSIYTPSDIIDRGLDGTIACDLNKKELPRFKLHEVAVFSGVLEYILDVSNIIRHLSKFVNIIICSYAPTEYFPNKFIRRKNGWVNDYSIDEFKQIFINQGFYCEQTLTWKYQIIFKFIKKNPPT